MFRDSCLGHPQAIKVITFPSEYTFALDFALISRSIPTLTINQEVLLNAKGPFTFYVVNAWGPGTESLPNAQGPGKIYYANTRGCPWGFSGWELNAILYGFSDQQGPCYWGGGTVPLPPTVKPHFFARSCYGGIQRPPDPQLFLTPPLFNS